jgi:ParB/RepB/Spo0J family partition protein
MGRCKQIHKTFEEVYNLIMVPYDNGEEGKEEIAAPFENTQEGEGPVLEEEIQLPDKEVSVPNGQLVALDSIELLDNPRGEVGDVGPLAESIRVQGLLHPVVVRPAGGDHGKEWELVVGYRRYAAHQLLERKEIPVLIHQANDQDVLAEVITENLQRQGWSPLAEARAMKRMIDIFGWNRSRVAAQLGVNRSQVSKRLALLDLPEKVRSMVSEESISASHAEVLMGLHSEEAQEEMAELAAKSGASVQKLSSWAAKVKEQEEEEISAKGALAKQDVEQGEDFVFEEVRAEALLDQDSPMELVERTPVTELPSLDLAQWDEEEEQRALLYLLLRASNDREVLEYLEESHGVLRAGLWDWVSGVDTEDLAGQTLYMIQRWYRAPHRYSTFPPALRNQLGNGEVYVPPREEAPDWSSDDDDFDEWEDDWGEE